MKCLEGICRSPIACEGFGYCRTYNQLGLARKAIDEMSQEQLKAMWERVQKPRSLDEIVQSTYDTQDLIKKIFKNMPGGNP